MHKFVYFVVTLKWRWNCTKIDVATQNLGGGACPQTPLGGLNTLSYAYYTVRHSSGSTPAGVLLSNLYNKCGKCSCKWRANQSPILSLALPRLAPGELHTTSHHVPDTYLIVHAYCRLAVRVCQGQGKFISKRHTHQQYYNIETDMCLKYYLFCIINYTTSCKV